MQKKEKGLFLDDTAYEYPNGECKEWQGESFVVKVWKLKPNSNLSVLVI